MATLQDLRDRVIRETNREELLDAPNTDPTAANSDTLDQCIQRAIEFYANERFSFNEATQTTDTAIGSENVAYPDGLRFIDSLSVNVGGNRYDLIVRDYTTIDTWLGYGPTAGQPTDYAVTTGLIQIYPVPTQVYTLTILGVVDLPLDYNDPMSSNAWTNEAQDLISARTRFLLQRDYFRDVEGATLAGGAEQQALTSLRGKTTRKLGTGRLRGSW